MTLRIVHTVGKDELSRVFVAELGDGMLIEFAESVQPPFSREQKWVLIISTLKGCPINCLICDAGGEYHGLLSAREILSQIDHMIIDRYPDRIVPISKFKIQFARMGDPAFNDAVLDVLRYLPENYDAPGLMPCISTVAPMGRESFFERLLIIKNEIYSQGRFQLQFSIHSTCEAARSRLIPARTWTFPEISSYGERFFMPGDRKVCLNFAPPVGFPLEPADLTQYFNPNIFIIKLTPINPTFASARAQLTGVIDPENSDRCEEVADTFRNSGYETILSIGEVEENSVGSNCGMMVRAREQAEICGS